MPVVPPSTHFVSFSSPHKRKICFSREHKKRRKSVTMDAQCEAGPSRQRTGDDVISMLPTGKPRKRPAKLKLAARQDSSSNGTRSVPSSPAAPLPPSEAETKRTSLRDTMRGAPRRRPSVLFPMSKREALPALAIPSQPQPDTPALPRIWQDPSEHTLSGNGSSLQHARSSYAAGAIEVLPGLFLGDEFNARDEEFLAAKGISTILNVSKEIQPPRVGQVEAALERALRLNDDVATPTVQSFQSSTTGANGPSPALFFLRSHASTPNFGPFIHGLSSGESSESETTSDTSIDSQDSQSSVELADMPSDKTSPPDSASLLTPVSSSFGSKPPDSAATSTSSSSSSPGWNILLPHEATTMQLSPVASTARTWPIRYIQLPWTHDQTDLASASSHGGFITGCAIIADALGLEPETGRMPSDYSKPRGILVHCQCGVSRSATLVIAFVMQAAAMQYAYEQTAGLTGMHDCYGMVKDLSSSISPNISLIYQLVEWERYLSAQVSSHTSADNATVQFQHAHSPDTAKGVVHVERRWGKEVMDEETWMRMRAEEERREQMEEQERMQAKTWHVSPPLAAVAPASTLSPSNGLANGVAARRKKSAPRLVLADSAVDGADRAMQVSIDAKSLPLRSRQSQLAINTHVPARNSTMSPMGSKSFGPGCQSAAERRIRHQRTFSTDAMQWPPALNMTTRPAQ